jgi:hypothetical protein
MHKIYRSLWNIGYKIFCNTERENFLWRMAFYRTWDQLQPIIFRNTIKRQLEFFKSIGKSRILVVPIANLIPDVDTEFVLPSTISRISGVGDLNFKLVN